MPNVIYIESNGTPHTVEAQAGLTLMQIALSNMVPGILGDCGGVCSCATCHVYVDEAWRGKLPPMSESETFLIDGVPDQRAGSRLSCQLRMRDDLEGLIVHLPVDQY
ncbi:2Fe-2S iron-sulfur cluster binding domain-containing protein [Pseudomonas gingeri]|uniref:2Fe-2S iron-sulfur cluster-binding protein n=1 Tax=Pseudomonas gingeri TaxID=117681 RepID=UPI0015A0E977|nr:2Fe-2S iron-sulfur cluster-binding protein [Pseudomonas gingeri]NWD66911.1 2Fe-2S iron-sulfur cluster binding domain-containing protein [Pseudomonas gingeri]